MGEDYVSFSINGTMHSWHKDITDQIEIFAAIDDIHDRLNIEYNISKENLDCVVKCLFSYRYHCVKDIGSFIEIFKFINYLGVSKILTEEILNKIQKKYLPMDRFIDTFKNCDDSPEMIQLLNYFIPEVDLSEDRSIWKHLVENFPPKIRLHIATKMISGDISHINIYDIHSSPRHCDCGFGASHYFYSKILNTLLHHLFGIKKTFNFVYFSSERCTFFVDEQKIIERNLKEDEEIDVISTISCHVAKQLVEVNHLENQIFTTYDSEEYR
uniref:Uncharacterized protein n=1 Tax=viral metagenome TaxID=1070528 RepID=A0A6C0CBI4_9ZZZZ